MFSTALPAIPTITIPVNAFEMPSASTAGSSAFTNQSDTNAAPTPATARTTSPVANENGTSCALLERGLAAIAPQIAPEPDAVDGEQKDGADGRDRDRMLARTVADGVGEPEQDDDEDGEQEQRRRVVRQALPEAHHAVSRRERARDDREAEHEQRVREQRAEDRRLRDDDLAGREREEDDEELGQVPERRLQHAGRRRAEAGADGLRREADHPGEPGERCGRHEEHGHRRHVREMECAGDDAQPENPGEES